MRGFSPSRFWARSVQFFPLLRGGYGGLLKGRLPCSAEPLFWATKGAEDTKDFWVHLESVVDDLILS